MAVASSNVGKQRVGFVGAGAMAEAMARGFITSGVLPPERVLAADPDQSRHEALQQLGASTTSSSEEVISACDVVFVAVKPTAVPDALSSVQHLLSPDHLVVSIAAGLTLDYIRSYAGPSPRLIRVMPNTPALVGRMAAALAADSSASDRDVEVACTLLQSMGTVHVLQEKLLDAATGVCGSGPAYLYLAIEAMADGGVEMGLPRQVALNLAAETVAGAGEMAASSGKHPAQLKDNVTSAGGTTIAAVHELERNGVRNAFMDAVRASAQTAAKMGKNK